MKANKNIKPELLEPKEIEVETITEDQYDDMLDDAGPIEIGNLKYNPSHVLKTVDPIAYNCGFSDIQEYKTEYECPICGENHDEDYDAAKFCCQSED